MIAALDTLPVPTRLVSMYAGSFYERADRKVHRYALTLPGHFGEFTRRGNDGGSVEQGQIDDQCLVDCLPISVEPPIDNGQ